MTWLLQLILGTLMAANLQIGEVPITSAKSNKVETATPAATVVTKEELLAKTTESQPSTNLHWVIAILDGDTLLVSDKKREIFQVRLLGVDTQEVNGPDSTAEGYAFEATLFTTEFLKNRAVRLTQDPANRDIDPYGRKLRYVEALQDDGAFHSLNQALVELGYATFPSQYPITNPNLYSTLEKNAKTSEAGLWGACQEDFPTENSIF